MEKTQLTEREREFFEKLHALCVEYNASIYGDAEKIETMANYGMGEEYMVQSFKLSIDGKQFEEVRVNDPNDWGRNPDKLTLVQLPHCFDLVLHTIEGK